jgi:D-glycero-D-manno-heptose 1,7-bisphosphate phosphatase
MNKAIFLDRDGVVNRERGEYTWKIEDFILNDGLTDFIFHFQSRGFLILIISNQGGIGKGVYSHNDVIKAHAYLQDELLKKAIKLTDIYYCPHHPNTGKCLCRKPGSLMLEKAIARYHIDATQSIFIGDSIRDVDAGNAVGLNTLLVQQNDNLMDYIEKVETLVGLI